MSKSLPSMVIGSCVVWMGSVAGCGTGEVSVPPRPAAAADDLAGASAQQYQLPDDPNQPVEPPEEEPCGGHGEVQCNVGEPCDPGLQACIGAAELGGGACWYCCADAAQTCGQGCQYQAGWDQGYYDPDCAPSCGGHGEVQCPPTHDAACADGLQACIGPSAEGGGQCWYCCADADGICPENGLCQADDSGADFYDPDCQAEPPPPPACVDTRSDAEVCESHGDACGMRVLDDCDVRRSCGGTAGERDGDRVCASQFGATPNGGFAVAYTAWVTCTASGQRAIGGGTSFACECGSWTLGNTTLEGCLWFVMP
jgi:hypothetical protein